MLSLTLPFANNYFSDSGQMAVGSGTEGLSTEGKSSEELLKHTNCKKLVASLPLVIHCNYNFLDSGEEMMVGSVTEVSSEDKSNAECLKLTNSKKWAEYMDVASHRLQLFHSAITLLTYRILVKRTQL